MGYFEQKWAYYSTKRERNEESMPLCFEAAQDDCAVTLNKTGTPASVSLEYSLDNHVWYSYSVGTEIALAHRGDRLFFKGKNSHFSSSGSNYYGYAMSGRVMAHGNVMSLIDPTCVSNTIPSGEEYFFYNLFAGCPSLLTPPLLPATTLRSRCYAQMFRGDVSLLFCPELPATGLASYCYQNMFRGCVSVKETPRLPGNTNTYNGACFGMFQDCTGLLRTKNIRLSTGRSNAMSNMFSGCESLNSVEVSFTSWGSSGTDNWLSGVASSGTFICPASLDTTVRSASRIPDGWTIVTK